MQDRLSNLKDIISDPQTLIFELKKKRKDVGFWIFGFIFTMLIWTFFSSKDYSFLIVLSSTVQMLSFIIVLWKVITFESASGLSQNTLISYSLLLFSRLSSTLFYNGYLPSDTAGDWFYQFTEIISLVSVIFLIFLIRTRYSHTREESNDSVDYKYLAIPSFCLALLVHTSLNRNFVTDVLWTFSMYLETAAIYPQIFLFSKKGGQIESYTSHYVALQGLSRLFSLLFWWDTFSELNEPVEDSYSMFHNYVGYFLILSQVIQLLIMIDYYYLYFKSILKGERMNIINL